MYKDWRLWLSCTAVLLMGVFSGIDLIESRYISMSIDMLLAVINLWLLIENVRLQGRYEIASIYNRVLE